MNAPGSIRYHHGDNRFYLSYNNHSSLVDLFEIAAILESGPTNKKQHGGTIMSEKHNHIETDGEREDGHVDTREKNFECENKDPHLGCDPGIDVAG